MLTPTELKQLCDVYGLRPSKKYGQNYLIQDKPIQDILAAGAVTPDDTIVEVGPGFGVLTLPLAERAKRVVAFEIEQKLRPYWSERLHEIQTKKQTLEIIWGNALDQFPQVASTLPPGYKVLANLPYQITSHMLRTFLEVPTPPERIVVMVQKEVAERMCAQPGDMSMLSVAVQYYGTPRIVSTVTRGNFFPSPNVDSAIVAITEIVNKPGAQVLFQFVRAGFHNKRKQLAKNLADSLHLDRMRVQTVLETVTGRADVRAEMLSIEQWEAVVTALVHTN